MRHLLRTAGEKLTYFQADQNDLPRHVLDDLRAFKLATDHALTRRFREDYAQAHGTSSDYKLKRLAQEWSGKACTPQLIVTLDLDASAQLESLSPGIDVQRIRCCPEGHMAFTGPYKNALVCPFPDCGRKRYKERDGRPVKDQPTATYSYVSPSSLIAMLQRNPEYAGWTRYRHRYLNAIKVAKESGVDVSYSDIYGSEHFESLADEIVTTHRPKWSAVAGPDGVQLIDDYEAEIEVKHKFFDGTVDHIFGLFTDGVQLFRMRGNNDCWPVILVNYTIPPEHRFKTENVMPIMLIPGPKQPRDLDSFLEPLYDEARSAAKHGRWVVDPIGGSEVSRHMNGQWSLPLAGH